MMAGQGTVLHQALLFIASMQVTRTWLCNPAGSRLPQSSYMSRYISVQPGAHHRYSPNEHRALGEGSPHSTRSSSYPFAVS